MEIRNLSTFLQVAMMKNFTKAGEVLGYSQSNVSAQIKQLEDELGVPLFNRVGRSITLTQYGEDLVEYAQSDSCRKRAQTFIRIESFFK